MYLYVYGIVRRRHESLTSIYLLLLILHPALYVPIEVTAMWKTISIVDNMKNNKDGEKKKIILNLKRIVDICIIVCVT